MEFETWKDFCNFVFEVRMLVSFLWSIYTLIKKSKAENFMHSIRSYSHENTQNFKISVHAIARAGATIL